MITFCESAQVQKRMKYILVIFESWIQNVSFTVPTY